MTSFLRTRKDRQPRPESKGELPQAQPGSSQRSSELNQNQVSRTVDAPRKHSDDYPYSKS